jgi:carbamate kinase
MRVVIALGGNALSSPDGRATPEAQHEAVARASVPVAELVAAGHEVLLTHGNGPQVGDILLKNELAAAVVPPVPLSWCGAQTQATIGMLLMNHLEAALTERGFDKQVIAVVSRTLVDADDPAFDNRTKPVGRYVTQEDAEALMVHGERFVEIPNRGWRRVVASPEPLECLDIAAAELLLGDGFVVVCNGGGGIPTVRRPDGRLEGIEAVIDKDLTAALLAERVGADVLVIATDVENVVADWGTPQAQPIHEIEATALRVVATEQMFAAGSMGPKVEAVTRFVERTGGTAAITSLDLLSAAVAGEAGTRVLPSADATAPSAINQT